MALSLVGLGLGLTSFKGGGFDLRGYLSPLNDAFVFDYTDPDWLRLNQGGPNPVAANNDTVGLAISRRLSGQAAALDDYSSGRPELRGTGTVGTLGNAPFPAGSYNPTTGAGSVGRDAEADRTAVLFTGLTPRRVYRVDVENTGTDPLTVRVAMGNSFVASVAAGARAVVFVTPLVNTVSIEPNANSQTCAFVVHSIREVSDASATQETSGLRPRRVASAHRLGPELLTNGDFGAGASEWQAINAVLSVVNGALRVGDAGLNSVAYRSVSTVSGRSYRFQVTRTATVGDPISDFGYGANVPSGNYGDVSQQISANGTAFVDFVATAATTIVTLGSRGTGYAEYDNVSLREITGLAARFDGLDDNHLTAITTPAGPYFMAAVVTVPTSLSALQIIAGQRALLDERLFMGIEHTTGRAAGGVGGLSTGTIFGGPDLRGRRVAIGIAINGSTIRLFADGVIAYEGAQSAGGPAATMPLRIGALNDTGTAQFFFGGDVLRICGGTDFPDLARFNQLSAALGA